MKVILSKKGIDSSFSSKPMKIIDNNLFFIPIPSDDNTEIKYSEINLYQLIKDEIGDKLSLNGNKFILSSNTPCHLDPQLINYFNEDNFRGSFGQIKQAQSHLEKNNVKVNDLFLFYGWYKDADDKVHNDGKNVIFGYLQVGEIIKPAELDIEQRKILERKYPWLNSQPHWIREFYKNISSNTIYVARETCSFDKNIKGYGIFNYEQGLDLTSSESKSRTYWHVPKLSDCKTSCKGIDGKNKFNNDGRFRAPCRCQEIVLEENTKVEEWAQNLIKINVKS